MSDGETFLDDILEGVIVVEAPQSLPGEQDVDISRHTQQKPNSKRSSDRALQPQRVGGSLPNGVTKPAPTKAQRTMEPTPKPAGESKERSSQKTGPQLAEAAPGDILGIPEQEGAPDGHFDLANEINAVNDNAIDGPAREGGGQKIRWDQPSSFASIAREIAASVDADTSVHKLTQRRVQSSEEDEHSHVFFGKKGRRVGRVNRVTVIQVVGLLLVLVLGLAAEYKYVGRDQTPDANATTASQSQAGLPSVKLPPVVLTKPAGTLFEFASSASAQSATFAVSGSFEVAWSLDCSTLDRTSPIGFILQSGSQKAEGIAVEMTAGGTKSGVGSTLLAGSYALTVHAAGACSWTLRGLPAR
jgi:hypothetical protein